MSDKNFKTEEQKALEQAEYRNATQTALYIQHQLQVLQFRLISFQDFTTNVKEAIANYLLISEDGSGHTNQ